MWPFVAAGAQGDTGKVLTVKCDHASNLSPKPAGKSDTSYLLTPTPFKMARSHHSLHIWSPTDPLSHTHTHKHAGQGYQMLFDLRHREEVWLYKRRGNDKVESN